MHRIKDIPLFSKLSTQNIEKLERISSFHAYEANKILFYEGDKSKYLYVLLSGVLRMYKTNSKGQELYIHQFVPISFVGELACFENIAFPATAKFITKGEILKIDFKSLEQDFFKNPRISMEVIKSLTKKIKILSNVIHKEMILTADAKVAKFIIENYELCENLKNTQIASILNITPETLSRILTKFKKKGLIKISKNHHIEISNKEALSSFYK